MLIKEQDSVEQEIEQVIIARKNMWVRWMKSKSIVTCLLKAGNSKTRRDNHC
jgi:hypothetical protein